MNAADNLTAAWYKCGRCHHETPGYGRPTCEECGGFSMEKLEGPTLRTPEVNKQEKVLETVSD
jgi:hypothetical protein